MGSGGVGVLHTPGRPVRAGRLHAQVEKAKSKKQYKGRERYFLPVLLTKPQKQIDKFDYK